MFEQSGDPGPAGLDFPLVDLDLQQACQVPGQFPARLQGTPGRIAVVVLRLGIRSVLKQQFGYFRTSQESGRVQGRSAIPAAAVDRGPVLQHPIDGFDPAGQGRPYQGSQPECRVHPVDVGPVLEGAVPWRRDPRSGPRSGYCPPRPWPPWLQLQMPWPSR